MQLALFDTGVNKCGQETGFQFIFFLGPSNVMIHYDITMGIKVVHTGVIS